MSSHDSPPTPDTGGAASPRRPRTVVVVGAVATLAVVAAVGFVVGTRSGNEPTDASAPAAATSEPTSSPSPASSTPGSTPGSTSGVTPTSATPTASIDNPVGATYLQGRTVHLVDGGTVELPADPTGYAGAWQIGDDVFAVTGARGATTQVRRVDTSGEPVASYSAASDVVVDDARTAIAWITRDSQLRVVSADGDAIVATGLSPGEVVPTAMTGGAACVTGGSACHVYTTFSEAAAGLDIDASGTQHRLPSDAAVVHGAGDGLVTARTPGGARGPCDLLYDVAERAALLTRCDLGLRQIAPGGGTVAAIPVGNERVRSVDILRPDERTRGGGIGPIDAGLEAGVNHYAPKDGYVTSMAWQDADHLLVAVHVEAGSQVVRLGIDGSQDVVAGPAPEGGEARTELVLGTRIG